eukprot:TCALIF_05328-PA protein Name:"Protein of unknown function" AED:0.13 eAED:0.13 QI:0/0/0.5/0.5/0/0.5/2/102/185
MHEDAKMSALSLYLCRYTINMNKFLIICSLLVISSMMTEAIFDGGIISIPAGLALAGIVGLKVAGGIGFGAGVLASRGGRRGGLRFGRSVESIEDRFLQASVDDADDCAKKLVCMVNATPEESMTAEEKVVAEMFGYQDEINVSKSSVEFDLAALVGRKAGPAQCKSIYARCPHNQKYLIEVLGA